MDRIYQIQIKTGKICVSRSQLKLPQNTWDVDVCPILPRLDALCFRITVFSVYKTPICIRQPLHSNPALRNPLKWLFPCIR